MKPRTLLLLAALAAAPCLYAQAPPAPSPEMQAAREAMRKACADDMKNLCGDKQGREAFACMRENSDKLSQGCKDAMAKMPRRPAPPPPAQ
ncbi:MAG TPA: hypothetical protein VMB48_12650 [Steroidobacteraceae bacterium]|nr:hypothetical protein [Steroidobacteraceae bacterium]